MALRCSRWLPLVVALALAVALFGPLLLSDRYLVSGHDVLWNYLAAGFYRHHLFADGAVPLWDPYVFSGTPFFQYVPTYLAYPLGYLVHFLPLVTAVNYLYILPLPIAAAAMYAYGCSRGLTTGGALVAALGYGYGGCFLIRVWAGHLELVNAFAYLPLLFLLAERLARRRRLADGLLFGLALGLVTCFGSIQSPATMLLGLGLYGLWSLPALFRLGRGEVLRLVGLLALAGVVGLGLSAVYWLPNIEFAELSNRGGGASFEFVTRNSLRPQDLITLLFPDLLGHEASGDWWGPAYSEAAFYGGLATTLLAAIAAAGWRRDRFVAFLLLLVGVSLALSLGRHTPLYAFLYQIPPFNVTREPWRFMPLFAFAVALLGGLGYGRVFDGAAGDAMRRRWRWLAAAYGSVAALALVAPPLFRLAREPILAVGRWVVANLIYGRPGHPLSLADYVAKLEATYADTAAHLDGFRLGNPAIAAPLALGVACLALMWLALRWPQYRGGLGVAVIVLLALDLYVYGAGFVQPLDVAARFREPDFVAFLRRDIEPFRIFPMEGAATPFEENDGELYHVQNVDGYASFLLRRYQELANVANGRPLSYFDAIGTEWTDSRSKLVDLLNVKYVLGATDEPPPAGYPLAFRGDAVAVYERTPFVPRAVVVHRYRVLGDPSDGRTAILAALADSAFDPRQEVILEAEPAVAVAVTSDAPSAVGESAVRWLGYSPNRLSLEVEAAAAGLLVLSEVRYPGWRAYVDGREAPVLRANYAFRAVALESGRRHVEFVFTPLAFYVGAAISVATLVATIGALGACWQRQRLRVSGKANSGSHG